MEKIQLSASKIKSWLTCKKQYFYRYIQKIRKKLKPIPLEKGLIIHSLLEAYLKGKNWKKELEPIKKEYDKLMDEEKEYYGDIVSECENIMQRYIEYYADTDKKLGNLLVEFKFNDIEVFPNILFSGIIDWVYQDENKNICLCEHKIKNSLIYDDADLAYEIQVHIYSQILTMAELPPQMIVFNFVSTVLPKVPKILKDGTLSKQKIITDYKTLSETLAKHKLQEKEYEKELQEAKKNNELFFKRIHIPRTQVSFETFKEIVVSVADEIRKMKKIYNNLGSHCNWCPYKSLCFAEIWKLDYNFILEKDYEPIKENEDSYF